MWNLQSYPATVLNERMWHFRGSKYTLTPLRPTYFHGGSRPFQSARTYAPAHEYATQYSAGIVASYVPSVRPSVRLYICTPFHTITRKWFITSYHGWEQVFKICFYLLKDPENLKSEKLEFSFFLFLVNELIRCFIHLLIVIHVNYFELSTSENTPWLVHFVLFISSVSVLQCSDDNW